MTAISPWTPTRLKQAPCRISKSRLVAVLRSCSSQACPPEAGRLIFRAVKKSERPEIPRKTIYRLSIYLRCLARLRDNGIRTVSSEALAKVAGVKSTQLRKDLTYFGQFGTRGLGYDVDALSTKLTEALGNARLQ